MVRHYSKGLMAPEIIWEYGIALCGAIPSRCTTCGAMKLGDPSNKEQSSQTLLAKWTPAIEYAYFHIPKGLPYLSFWDGYLDQRCGNAHASMAHLPDDTM